MVQVALEQLHKHFQGNWFINFDTIIDEELHHILFLHREVLRSNVYKDCRLEAILGQAFWSLRLFRVQNPVLLEEIEAEDSLLVWNACGAIHWSLRLQQVVQLDEVIEVELLTIVHDRVDVEQLF